MERASQLNKQEKNNKSDKDYLTSDDWRKYTQAHVNKYTELLRELNVQLSVVNGWCFYF